MRDTNKPSDGVDDFLARLTSEQMERLRRLGAGERGPSVSFDIEAEQARLEERIKRTTDS